MKASRITAKYSGAPMEIANLVISGAVNTTSSVPMVPATKEPMAAVASAWAASPALAIRLPSMAVTTDDDSPGVFSRMDVVDPPYMPPYRMPASMIMRTGRLQAVGDRQQQRDRHGRTDARQAPRPPCRR